MRHLDEMIYRLLLEQEMTGYSIAKEIEKRTGWKPSWGSIYPQLENMQKCAIIAVKQEGRSKMYTLTPNGKKYAQERLLKTAEIIEEIVRRMRVMQEMTGQDMSMPVAFLTSIAQGDNQFLSVQEQAEKLRGQIHRLYKENKLTKNRTKINNILKHATKQLMELK